MRIDFDEGPLGGAGQGTRFAHPRQVIRAHRAEGVGPALLAIEAARAQGYWIAGYFSYEMGYALDAKLAALSSGRGGVAPEQEGWPLLEIGVFDAPQALADPASTSASTPSSTSAAPQMSSGPRTSLTPLWSAAQYHAAFARVHDHLLAGDTYQVNLTVPLEVHSALDPEPLYRALKACQPVRFGAFVDLGTRALLSRSPELFFATDAQGAIEVRPMKGTVARGATPTADAAAKAWLETSEKNLAENLMIVDLLRNDLSRICDIGSVKTPHLFAVETYATVHQMVSRITGRLAAGTSLTHILTALFPCGSITGAPKLRAMEIIHDLEDTARGPYCGAIGWMAPDGRSVFNVAIRTLLLRKEGATWQGRLNVGGGLVFDSQAEDEWEEALLKARFAQL
ncbi:Aminodeoxychorismate synthase component 1 [Aquimixticola soesokkakensis]|uniref:Aminodeoxychorismate synthase component 1 n=1 Tax=Aquimixticola soesokkakensis TaxID=1519096 RepID=A0A1Y5S3U0_9RHOB|nr:aminodeoxychorismate synthase component I [Aquimixticola soesokkakensis]SLN32031.1 Aminodeoxychorismate synthase component 1 [Aquimixticola soesokkakensis]